MLLLQAFRPGNVDLAPTHAANPNTLILPDAVTELDLFAPLPDPEELLRDDAERRGPGRDPTLLDFGTSQLLSETQNTPRREKQTRDLDDIDIDLDFGLGPNEQNARMTPTSAERSVEVGRRATGALRDEPTFLDGDDLGLDYGFEGDTTLGRGGSVQPPADYDMSMLDDGYQIDVNNDVAADNARAGTIAEERLRDSASPLSDVPADFERTFQFDANDVEQDETRVQAAQRVKRRKVMQQDSETQLHNTQIRKQQEDRSAITKQPTFLPRDPLLLQLMEMQRNGSFVSNIMGDGRMAGWAPELRSILSLEVVRKAGEKKRKRDSGIADVDTDGEARATPSLEIPQDEDEGFQTGAGADYLHSDGAAPPLMSDGVQPQFDDGHGEPNDFGAFDTTEAPLLHPSQSGPVSLGTKNAVHLLREHFAPDHPRSSTVPPTPSKRVKAEAMFTDLCPEKRTSRPDATKMFFELLVLGTKDAIKVEQESKELGMPIRVRGKRGLWGDWAERGAGGEIASQTAVEQTA